MIENALISFLALVGILLVFYGPWQDVCADYARQVVFEKRDKLFDYAREGRIDFNSPEYKSIRSGLETSIRFAHDITLIRFIYLAVCLKEEIQGGVGVKAPAVKSSLLTIAYSIQEESLRNEVLSIVIEAQRAIVFSMAARSFMFICLAPIIFICGAMAWCLKSARSNISNTITKIGEAIQIKAESVDCTVVT
jgi:hypothetical protein